jgi:hypothetical protein
MFCSPFWEAAACSCSLKRSFHHIQCILRDTALLTRSTLSMHGLIVSYCPLMPTCKTDFCGTFSVMSKAATYARFFRHFVQLYLLCLLMGDTGNVRPCDTGSAPSNHFYERCAPTGNKIVESIASLLELIFGGLAGTR